MLTVSGCLLQSNATDNLAVVTAEFDSTVIKPWPANDITRSTLRTAKPVVDRNRSVFRTG